MRRLALPLFLLLLAGCNGGGLGGFGSISVPVNTNRTLTVNVNETGWTCQASRGGATKVTETSLQYSAPPTTGTDTVIVTGHNGIVLTAFAIDVTP